MEENRSSRLDYFTRVIPLDTGDSQAPPRSHQLAGGGGRFLAGLADLLLQLVTYALIAWFVLRTWPNLITPRSARWLGPVGFLEWHIIYHMLFESISGGYTPGKALAGLRVLRKDGQPARPIAFVLRNIMRVADILAAGYLASLALISRSPLHQRLGDMAGGTIVVYSTPLVSQLQTSRVPESLYSTSEDGYLLQAWMSRELNFDEESRLASAVDLAAYLHSKYDSDNSGRKDPVVYLHQLYEDEAGGMPAPENPETLQQN